MLRSLTHDILNGSSKGEVGSKSNPVFPLRINSLCTKYESKISQTKLLVVGDRSFKNNFANLWQGICF